MENLISYSESPINFEASQVELFFACFASLTTKNGLEVSQFGKMTILTKMDVKDEGN